MGTYCTQWDYVEDRFGKKDLLPFTISDMDLEFPFEITEVLQERLNHRVLGYSRWKHDDFRNSVTIGILKDLIVALIVTGYIIVQV